MASLEIIITGLAWVALLAAGVVLVREGRRIDSSAWIAVGCLLCVFVVRWLFTTPMLVHANMHGPLLLNAPYEDPTRVIRNYGPFSILVQGMVMHGVGANLTVVAAMNQLFAVLTLGLMAHVAWRWTGSRVAAVCVGAVAALHPVLMRQGSSEDAHNLAVLLAWLGIVLAESYAQSGRRAALVGCAAAVILMLETRQIMFAFVPLFPLWILARARRDSIERRQVALAVGAMVAVLAVRIIASALDPDQAGHMSGIFRRLSTLEGLWLALVRHPLLDLRYAAHLLPFMVIGAAWLSWRSWAGRMLVVAVVALFASSLWLFEGQNVALMFRLPVLTLGLWIAGIGAWRLTVVLGRLMARSWLSHLATGFVVISILVAPTLFSGWQILARVPPLTREYQYIEAALPSLPRRLTLVPVLKTSYPHPAYRFPVHLLQDDGIVVQEVVESGVPAFFLRGVICRAYSLSEVFGIEDLRVGTRLPAEHFSAAMGLGSTEGLAVPAVQRPECDRLMAGAVAIGEPARLEPAPQDPPFVFYSADPIEVQFYRLPDAEVGSPRSGDQ